MKSKGSPSLYEVLKSASRPSGEGAPAASAPAGGAPSPGGGESGPTLQERLAAYKAAKLAEAQAAAVATEASPPPPTPAPEPAAATVVVSPPAVRSEPVAPPAAQVGASEEKTSERGPAPEAGPGLGERVVTLTYNTLAFAALVGVGLLFVAYALGVKVGRARAAEAAATETVRPAPPPRPPAPPPAPPKQYTIRLAEWRYATPRDRVTAEAEAEDLRKALERAGYRGVEKVKIERAGEPRLALYIDRLTDYASPAARERLAALQKFRLRNGTAPFAAAAFEEVPK
ncbi:MAG TPA: hypothetical protein VNO22_04065 [Planctomycetota bacterium]|nr:hypothetical protein [Planctomycetota bacterium]